jgi:hypothetical protein
LRLRFGGILAQAPCWRASSLGALERKNPKDAVQDAPVVDTRNATRLVRMATDASNRQNRNRHFRDYPLTGHAAGTPKSTLMTQSGCRTAYLVLLGDGTSLVNPEFGSRQCAHNELDREMRD